MTPTRGMQELLITSGIYIDPVNRERALYLAGFISLEEFERRVEAILASR